MSLSRIRPKGWPTNPTVAGDWLTAAELNALDIDHTNAVDKMNGDTVAGPVVLDGAQGGSMEIDGPISITGAGSTLKTQNGGRIVIDANELGQPYWPQYSPPRAFTRTQPIIVQMAGSLNWLIDDNQSTAQGGIGQRASADITRSLVDGSTLTAIDIFFKVSVAHNSFASAPATMPSFTLFNKGFTSTDLVTLATGSVPSPASGAAWYAAGAVQVYTLLVPSAVIDRTGGSYFVDIQDENGTLGTNAAVGNIYQSFAFHFTCADQRPA